METLELGRANFNTYDVETKLRWDGDRAGSISLEELVEIARRLALPKAIYKASSIKVIGERAVEVAGVTFESPVLRNCLRRAESAFSYIVTIGPGLESEAGTSSDLLRQYGLEELANMALYQAAGRLADRIERRTGLSPLCNISPGSLEDWPITEQAKLFSIFGDTEQLIGVRLTESMLMIPRKSISGILFPSDEGFVACRLCTRVACPSRKADPQSSA